jgi:hypothetical protein
MEIDLPTIPEAADRKDVHDGIPDAAGSTTGV